MIVLGIESSCDETGLAIVKNGQHVMASKVASSIDLHKEFGGVVPEVAAREHQKIIKPLFEATLAEANVDIDQIDAIAVTQGPGLIGCLLVGSMFAKGLAQFARKPLIPVNHIYGHVYGAFLGMEEKPEDLFPCLTFVVSGGHTHLYLMRDHDDFELVLYSIDDAVGECFDKVGKMLGLPYPAGPFIEKEALTGNREVYEMPRMMKEKAKLAYSYSGLKTHVVYLLKGMGIDPEQLSKNPNQTIDSQVRADICAAFQEEAFGQLVRKLTVVLSQREDVAAAKHLIIAGGVAANKRLMEMVGKNFKGKVHAPKLSYCMDNGAMIASYGYYKAIKNKNSIAKDFYNYDWDAFSRYPYGVK